MKKSTIPTILGITILVMGIAAGVLLVENQQIFRLGAEGGLNPKDIRITNIDDSSYSISWTTDKQVEGILTWGDKPSSLTKIETEEDDQAAFVHLLTIDNLKPVTTYYFTINSGGVEFDNDGIPWQVKTGSELVERDTSLITSGTILNSSGIPIENVLVYVTVGGSSPLSTKTSDKGSWVLPIGKARTKDLTSFVNINETTTLLEISIQGGPAGIATAQIYPYLAKPAPAITLGQVHDFKNISPVEEGEVPDATIELPDGTPPPEIIDIPEATPIPDENVTLDNLEEGDLIANSESIIFLGKGPPGIILTITVESEPVTEKIEINEDGEWNWSFPDNLTAGEHQIVINWLDASGILKTISKSFIVEAQTLSPTLTPTTSPSPTPTNSPTPTPTSTPTPTKVATVSALPVAGSLTPTFVLIMMGSVSVFLGSLALSILYKSA